MDFQSTQPHSLLTVFLNFSESFLECAALWLTGVLLRFVFDVVSCDNQLAGRRTGAAATPYLSLKHS